MPIHLPPPPLGIALPAMPANPPILSDVIAARAFQDRVNIAVGTQQPGKPTAIDAARADIYKTNVIVAHSAEVVAPALVGAGIAEALQGVLPAALEAALPAALEAALQVAIEAVLPAALELALHQALPEALAPAYRLAAKTYNLQCGDGSGRPFEIIPFNDGTLPTDDHNLPALTNVIAVRSLTAAQASDYTTGYGLGNIGQAGPRKKAIGRFIGCTVAV